MQEGFNLCKSPEAVLSFSEGEIISKVQVYNPVFDYVPPDLVTLFISNMWVDVTDSHFVVLCNINVTTTSTPAQCQQTELNLQSSTRWVARHSLD